MTSVHHPTPLGPNAARLDPFPFGGIAVDAADRCGVGLTAGERKLLISRSRGHSRHLDLLGWHDCIRDLFDGKHEVELGHLLTAFGPVVCALLRHREDTALVAALVQQQMQTDAPPEQGSPGSCWWQPPQRPRSEQACELEVRAAELQLLVIRAAVAALSLGFVQTSPAAPSIALRRALQLHYFDMDREAGHMAVAVHAFSAWHGAAVRAGGFCALSFSWKLEQLTVTYDLSVCRSVSLARRLGPSMGASLARRPCRLEDMPSNLAC